MDHIVLKTAKYNEISDIALQSAHHLVHEDFLIELLISVEQYLMDASSGNLESIKKAYDVCSAEFPLFFGRRTDILTRMHKQGIVNMRAIVENTNSEPDDIEPTSDSSATVINLFGKPVDKDV